MTLSLRISRKPVPRALGGMLCAWAIALAAPVAAQSLGPGIVPKPQPPSREDTSGLTADIFYRVILGDVALQRGEASLAARAYYEAARETGDPRLARRAAEVAFAARMRGLAQESAKLWASLDPMAERPKQMLAALAASASRGDVATIDPEIKARLEKALAEAAQMEQGPGELFLEINRMARDAFDKRQVYELVRELAKPYPNSAEAHFAIALAAYNGGAPEGQGDSVVLEEVERALAIKPSWERAALLKSDALARKNPDEAIAFLVKYTAANPDARSASGALAQLYVERKRYREARAIFQKLWDNDRSAREFEFGVAVISMQMKDWETAEALFTDLKKAGYGDNNGAVELYLAQIAEERGNYAEAIALYKAVPDSERGWLARLRVAAMMGKQGNVADARKYLADLPAVTIEQRVQVRQAEAQLLRDANDLAGAYAVLEQAIKEHPDSPELLYDIAMVAERLDKIDDALARLKRVVELKPDDAQSLNALGYTMVDRTTRISEGLALIERAHKLSPDDPFILDSMGWAMFKLGRYTEAERYLRRAMEERPDAEIAAHLGEVLWAKGERERAQEVWQSQLKVTPDNQLLLETVRRLAR